MRKFVSIIVYILLLGVTVFVFLFGFQLRYLFTEKKTSNVASEDDFLYGSKKDEFGVLSLRIRIDDNASIKEVDIIEHPDNEYANMALQKLINNSLDKQNVDEIDTISSATVTSETYKSILKNLLKQEFNEEDENKYNTKISMQDKEVLESIERIPIEGSGYKSGIGAYVYNHFQDADYDKNGNLVTNEYICAVLLNPNNRIEDVRFDHISSNINFTRNGKIPTGGARAYTFTSDKAKVGFNGLVSDENYVNIYDFENEVLKYRHFDDIKNKFVNKKGYTNLVYALENAIDNARVIGAGDGDSLGLAAYKVLKKTNIKDATDTENGRATFDSDYCMVTVNRELKITSIMFDNVENTANITDKGSILGSRDKEIYTLNELSNTNKYTKITIDDYAKKLQLNFLGDYLRSSTIDNIMNIITNATDNRGKPKVGSAFETLDRVDLISSLDIITRAYTDAITIK